jgi:hypothetical protein
LGRETQTYGGPAAKSGNSYWTTNNTYLGVTNPSDVWYEVAALRINEQLTLSPVTTFVSGGSGTNGFEALNVIASTLGGLGYFATGYGYLAGNPGYFDPVSSSNTTGSDTIFTGGIIAGFGMQPVPEPASVAIWALIVGGAGVVAVCRRRRTRVSAQC